MRISVLGTGIVGRTLAGALAGRGHEVVVGTRDPAATLARTEPDAQGVAPYAQWQREHPGVPLVPLAEAGARAEVLVNATNGLGSEEALTAAGVAQRPGLVVLDVANALEFGPDGPTPALPATDSLGERLQRAFPDARVVKALNTINYELMVDPGRTPGEHAVFVAGADDGAKAVVSGLLGELGWPAGRVVDLGGLAAARGTELYVVFWWSLTQALGTFDVNIAVLRP